MQETNLELYVHAQALEGSRHACMFLYFTFWSILDQPCIFFRFKNSFDKLLYTIKI